MLRDHAAGKLSPTAVDAPRVPTPAPALARRIYEDLVLRMGLRLAKDEGRALPYATSEAVLAGHTTDKRHASRALRWLRDHGYVWIDENAKCSNGVRMRTLCYLPGPKPTAPEPPGGWRVQALNGVPSPVLQAGAVPVEAEDVVRGVAVEPPREAVDEPGVAYAVGRGTPGALDWTSAFGDVADGGGSLHEPNLTPPFGAHRR
jgi:hypothetical protein